MTVTWLGNFLATHMAQDQWEFYGCVITTMTVCGHLANGGQQGSVNHIAVIFPTRISMCLVTQKPLDGTMERA